MNSAHPFYPILIPHTPYMHFTGVPRIYDKVKVTEYKTTDYRATIQIGKKKKYCIVYMIRWLTTRLQTTELQFKLERNKIVYSIYDKVVD